MRSTDEVQIVGLDSPGIRISKEVILLKLLYTNKNQIDSGEVALINILFHWVEILYRCRDEYH